jgi:hypothetical protein
MIRSGSAERLALYMAAPGDHTLQPDHPGFLQAAGAQWEAQEGGAGTVNA